MPDHADYAFSNGAPLAIMHAGRQQQVGLRIYTQSSKLAVTCQLSCR
jgi:hypothetical protein